MDIRISKHGESTVLCDTAIIPFTEGIEISEGLLYLDSDVEAMISYLVKDKIFTGKKEQIESFRLAREENPRNIILVGLGDDQCIDQETVKLAISSAIRKAKQLKSKVIEIHQIFNSCSTSSKEMVSLVAKYTILSDYDFGDYKAPKEDSVDILEVNLLVGPDEDMIILEKALDEGVMEGQSICVARALVNEPANIMTPTMLAEEAKKYGKEYGFDVKVMDEADIKALDMQAFLSVGKGSAEPMKLITMKYHGNPNDPEIYGLIGKGLTYDSGGYSIKPTDGMHTMKSDMGGAAAVIGAMIMVASQKLKINVTAVVASCENMISGHAYKPGDIIGSMAGKYIEITNTDAEGRLTLADALTYAVKEEKATKLIDIATLTGAAIVALGEKVIATLSSDDDMFAQFDAASKLASEKIWRLPLEKEYKKMLKSEVADLKNSPGRPAGTITASLFLEEFTSGLPWVHLDIAGPSWTDKASSLCPYGGTGAGVSLLYHFFKKSSY